MPLWPLGGRIGRKGDASRTECQSPRTSVRRALCAGGVVTSASTAPTWSAGGAAAEFPDGQTAESLGLTGKRRSTWLERGVRTLTVTTDSGTESHARVRIDTPKEWHYYRHGGILHHALRQLAADA
jgi:hypothetical protein